MCTGSALEKTGAVGEAVTAYSSIMPWLSSTSTPNTESAQFHMWGEHSIVRLCQLSDQSADTGESINAFDALRTYRYWAKFWDASKNSASEADDAARHRRLAWKAYYDSLSTILRRNLPYEPDTTPALAEKPSPNPQSDMRLRQRAELKRVEAVYENLLIKETKFPKASETNHEVESWVDSVMDNWRLLCGPTWTDEDLGEGGKEGVARGVLDVRFLMFPFHDIVLTLLRFSIVQLPRHITRRKYCATCSSCTRPWPSLSWRTRPTTPT